MKYFSILYILGVIYLSGCSGGNRQSMVFTGVVEATRVQVPALTGGRINRLNVDTGVQVEEGQVIASIDTLELSLRKEQLEGTLEEIEAQEKLADTRLEKARNDRDYLRQRYQRFSELLARESVTQQAVDDLENKLQAAQMAYKSARQQFNTITAKKKQLKAQFKLLNKKISDAEITAPLAGTISEKYFETGEAVPPLNPVAEIIDLEKVWVKIYVSEMLLPEIKVGQEVSIEADGLKKSLTGNISWINPKAEFTPKTILTPETRTSLVYAVKVLIANKERHLKQGMPVEIIIF